MFQNISKNTQEKVFDEDVEYNNSVRKEQILKILRKNFTVQNIIVYIIAFMISMVGGKESIVFTNMAPFSYAIVAATLGTGIPAIMVCLVSLIATTIKFGVNESLFYILTLLIFFALILIKQPLEDEEKNEKFNLGFKISLSVFLVQIVKIMFKGFLIYDLLYSIMMSVCTFVLYKIFVNSLVVFKEFGIKKVFSIEEAIGASLIIAIAFNSLNDWKIFNYSVSNILSILVVLVMGWKNGMLIGGCTGITIGTVVGILSMQEPIMIAAYAISGMISGILNKLGKIGVIIGFIIGNICLSYVSNGNTIEIIKFQEILIAALGLLAIPKSYKFEISDFITNNKLLPETTVRTLEENKDTINKLKNMSNTISQMAKEYGNAAVTVVTDEELERQEKQNREIFEEELYNNLSGKEENLLYDDIFTNNENIIEDIFKILIQNEVITRKDIVNIFSLHNNFIMGFNPEEKADNYVANSDIDEMLRVINSAYRISKLNFIWKKKFDQNKKTMSSQLNGVSEAISNLADQIIVDNDEFKIQKEQIKAMLEDKEIDIKDVTIKQDEGNKYIVNVYTGKCNSLDGKECPVKKIEKTLNKVLNEKMILQKQQCALRRNENICIHSFTSEDKYKVRIGISKSKKANSIISGDTTLQTKLEDGKTLIAISDGMGSGPEARKSSKIAIKMLERMLKSGFNNEVALKLINTTISANTDSDMYATLDVNILDLYNGNMKFIKNGACPTFVKRNNNVEILKAITLPTGILDNIDLVEYNYELQSGDIIIMCSDGILDSDERYLNRDLWLQELIEDIESVDPQRIADIILKEAIDNDFGKEKDDMTVVVAKITKNEKIK